MRSDSAGPLVVQRLEPLGPLQAVLQPPPRSARSSSATYIGPAGWAYDPSGREGTADLLALLLPSAAGRHDRASWARYLDTLGATVTTQTAPETTEVTVWGPTSVLGRLLDVLADVVLRPRFGSSDVERVRRQMIERQLRAHSQPESRVEVELLKSLFPNGHPYRETGIGTRQTIGRIGVESLRRFHRDHFTSGGAFVVLTAPVPSSTARRELAHRFGGFSRDAAPPSPAVPDMRRARQVERQIRMPGRTQTEIRLAGTTVPRASPQYPELFLANEILGGRPLLCRLFQVVRERHGLAYHASSDLEAMRWGGYWTAGAGTGPERAGVVLRLLRKELDRLREIPVGRAELDRIRESAIGELTLELETTSGAHELACDVAYHGLPEDFYRNWPTTLRTLTPSAVRSAIDATGFGAPAVTVCAGADA